MELELSQVQYIISLAEIFWTKLILVMNYPFNFKCIDRLSFSYA